MQEDIYIVGAGTYGEVMYELAEILGFTVKGFYDEDESKLNSVIMGTKVIGKFSLLKDNEIRGRNFIAAIGNNEARYNIMNKINQLGGYTPTLIHPSAIVSKSAVIGKGVYIQANAYIWTKVTIGDFCIISPSVVICHHTKIGKACLISNVSGVGASLIIEDKVFIGMGATIVTGLRQVGENSIIGAGSVVIEDLPPNSKVVGVPARQL